MRFIVCLHVLGLVLLGAGSPGRAEDFSSHPDASARKLYLAKCAKCHKLYDPAKYSDAQWATWMNKMSRKSKLQPDQKEMLARYIEDSLRSSKALPSPKPSAAR